MYTHACQTQYMHMLQSPRMSMLQTLRMHNRVNLAGTCLSVAKCFHRVALPSRQISSCPPATYYDLVANCHIALMQLLVTELVGQHQIHGPHIRLPQLLSFKHRQSSIGSECNTDRCCMAHHQCACILVAPWRSRKRGHPCSRKLVQVTSRDCAHNFSHPGGVD